MRPHSLLPRRIFALSLLLLLGPTACGGLSVQEKNARAQHWLAQAPVNNWIYLPEHQPFVGARAVFAEADSGAREEIELYSRSGNTTQLRVRWSALPTERADLDGLEIRYQINAAGMVTTAQLQQLRRDESTPLRIATAGEAGYGSQPAIFKLPSPVMIDTGARQLRADAIALSETLRPGGAITQVLYLSADADLGVLRKASVAANRLSVSDIVQLIAARQLERATGDRAVGAVGTDVVGERIRAAGPHSVSTLVEP